MLVTLEGEGLVTTGFTLTWSSSTSTFPVVSLGVEVLAGGGSTLLLLFDLEVLESLLFLMVLRRCFCLSLILFISFS